MNNFDAEEVKNECVQSIRDWFDENEKDCNAIVGLSSGKDSTIVTALCIEALGIDRVIGVVMPCDKNQDKLTFDIIRYFDLKAYNSNINYIFQKYKDEVLFSIRYNDSEIIKDWTDQAQINLPARIRMNLLRTYAQCLNGRVMNTCNASENYIGYSTVDGDASGDFSPLHNLTVTEVKAVGYALGLPKEFIEKVPDDGLCGKTDEENFGFSYDTLDRYIRTGICEDKEIKKKIDDMHNKNLFKLLPMACYRPSFLD